MDASSTAPADDSIAQEAVAAAETLTKPEAAEPPAEEDPSTRVYVFEATTKRVAASGDSFQVVLEMSGAHWLRYVANALHKGTNTLIVKPEQLRWTPPAKAPAFAVCGFDEELQRWVCRESDCAQDEPCAHYQAEDGGEVAEVVAEGVEEEAVPA